MVTQVSQTSSSATHKSCLPARASKSTNHNSPSLAPRQVYISEISSPDIRGFLSAIQKVSGHLGVLISYLLGAYLDWRQLAMLVSVAPMMLFVTVIYIPETPSFLVLKGRDEDAYR